MLRGCDGDSLGSTDGRKEVIVCGSFGFLNAGDEAVPLALADIAEDIGLSREVVKLSRWDTTPDEGVVDLGPLCAKKRKALAGSVVIYAGGGIIDSSPGCVLLRCHEYIREMRPESVSAFGVNVESGVLYSWLAKRKLRRYLGDMDHISVRDVLSQEALEGILRRGDVEIVGDLVLSMRAEEPHGIALPEGPFIAVTLAPVWSHESGWREWIARELATLSDDLNLALLFVPCGFGEEKDIGEHEAVASMTGLLTNSQISMCMDASGNPRKLAGIYARASVTIGVRLHACIMSWAQRTPFVGVAYHPKLVGFARTVGVLDWLVPSVFPACQAPGSYGYAWGELDLREDMLCNVAMAAMQEARFDTLEKFKGLQRRMLRRILMTNSGEHSS